MLKSLVLFLILASCRIGEDPGVPGDERGSPLRGPYTASGYFSDYEGECAGGEETFKTGFTYDVQFNPKGQVLAPFPGVNCETFYRTLELKPLQITCGADFGSGRFDGSAISPTLSSCGFFEGTALGCWTKGYFCLRPTKK